MGSRFLLLKFKKRCNFKYHFWQILETENFTQNHPKSTDPGTDLEQKNKIKNSEKNNSETGHN